MRIVFTLILLQRNPDRYSGGSLLEGLTIGGVLIGLVVLMALVAKLMKFFEPNEKQINKNIKENITPINATVYNEFKESRIQEAERIKQVKKLTKEEEIQEMIKIRNANNAIIEAKPEYKIEIAKFIKRLEELDYLYENVAADEDEREHYYMLIKEVNLEVEAYQKSVGYRNSIYD